MGPQITSLSRHFTPFAIHYVDLLNIQLFDCSYVYIPELLQRL